MCVHLFCYLIQAEPVDGFRKAFTPYRISSRKGQKHAKPSERRLQREYTAENDKDFVRGGGGWEHPKAVWSWLVRRWWKGLEQHQRTGS